jgi:cytochrome c-type protein NapB
MKILLILIITLGLLTAYATSAVETVNSGGLKTFRGASTLDETPKAERLKRVIKDKSTIRRNYVHQPPVIPHKTRGYRVDTNSNKCLTCHAWKYATETRATKISLTHYEARDGTTLLDVSHRRYFCLQCHVTQANAPDLIDNTFKPVESLGSE